VVIRAEIDYKRSLRSGDRFWIEVTAERVTRMKFAFLQDVYRSAEHVLRARITAAAVNTRGRPVPVEQIDPAMDGIFAD